MKVIKVILVIPAFRLFFQGPCVSIHAQMIRSFAQAHDRWPGSSEPCKGSVRRKLCVKQQVRLVSQLSHVSQASLEKLTGLTLERSNFTNILRRLAEKWPELILDAFETVSIANKGSFQLREGDFTTGISHCGRSKLWQHACGLLDIMPRVHLRPSVIPFSATISACEKGGQWQQALGLFEAMQTSRVHPDTISYNASISACEKAGEWQKALKLFVKMQEEGVSRDVYSFSATVSACEKGGQWQQALSLFEAMFVGKVCPNVVSYSAAISACEKSGRWQEALDLFERMPCANISPNVVSHSAVIGACEKGGQWQQALRLFEAMPRAKVSPMQSATVRLFVLAGRVVNGNRHWACLWLCLLQDFHPTSSATMQQSVLVKRVADGSRHWTYLSPCHWHKLSRIVPLTMRSWTAPISMLSSWLRRFSSRACPHSLAGPHPSQRSTSISTAFPRAPQGSCCAGGCPSWWPHGSPTAPTALVASSSPATASRGKAGASRTCGGPPWSCCRVWSCGLKCCPTRGGSAWCWKRRTCHSSKRWEVVWSNQVHQGAA